MSAMLVLTILGLALFETVSSIDNAIINAEVLSTMGKKARRWFVLDVSHAQQRSTSFFAELQAVLRATKSLWYVVETTGFIGSWNSHISWWNPHDPERELPDFKWWYNKRGERVTPCVDTRKSGLLPAISTPNLTRAFRIAQQELGRSPLPPETDRDESLLARVIHIGMFVPTLPPISILED